MKWVKLTLREIIILILITLILWYYLGDFGLALGLALIYFWNRYKKETIREFKEIFEDLKETPSPNKKSTELQNLISKKEKKFFSKMRYSLTPEKGKDKQKIRISCPFCAGKLIISL